MDSQAEIYLEKQTHLSFYMEMIREDEAKTVCEQDVVSDCCCCVSGAECAPIDHMALAKPANITFSKSTWLILSFLIADITIIITQHFVPFYIRRFFCNISRNM